MDVLSLRLVRNRLERDLFLAGDEDIINLNSTANV